MNLTQTSARSTVLAQTLFVALVGLTLVFAAGFAQSHALRPLEQMARQQRDPLGDVGELGVTEDELVERLALALDVD